MILLLKIKIVLPEATDEEIKLLFPNPLGANKKRKSKPKSSTSK